ncbi:MAG: flagellar export protein FliJ [Oscillospiraceae bacterium]|nr:flagellar export protein FliJ [Oscillospiraceae bacterium]
MKKFKFSLQVLQNYKLTVEKLQMAELKRAQQVLQDFQDEETRLLTAWDDNELSLEKALKSGHGVGAALSEHDAYFRFLRDELVAIREKIVKAEEFVVECQEKLMITVKELKTYEKLRDEQYQVWLKEAQLEDAKEMDDLVSFSVAVE